MIKTLSILAIATTLAACATPPAPQTRMAFPELEYTALPTAGTGLVRGQAFLKTRGGDVKTAAGNQVFLNPVTSYSLEWFQKSYLTGAPIVPPDPRLDSYMRKQTADGSGRFTFKNVPPGEYFVTTRVTWETPTGYQGSMETQGGTVSTRIKVVNGDEVDVIITR